MILEAIAGSYFTYFWFSVALSLVLGFFTTGYFSINNWVWDVSSTENQLYYLIYTVAWIAVFHLVYVAGMML